MVWWCTIRARVTVGLVWFTASLFTAVVKVTSCERGVLLSWVKPNLISYYSSTQEELVGEKKL